eukprot:s253_g23.t1
MSPELSNGLTGLMARESEFGVEQLRIHQEPEAVAVTTKPLVVDSTRSPMLSQMPVGKSGRQFCIFSVTNLSWKKLEASKASSQLAADHLPPPAWRTFCLKGRIFPFLACRFEAWWMCLLDTTTKRLQSACVENGSKACQDRPLFDFLEVHLFARLQISAAESHVTKAWTPTFCEPHRPGKRI